MLKSDFLLFKKELQLRFDSSVTNRLVKVVKTVNESSNTSIERRLQRLEESTKLSESNDLEYYVSTNKSENRWTSYRDKASYSGNLDFILKLSKKYKNSWVQGQIGKTGHLDSLVLVRSKSGVKPQLVKIQNSYSSFLNSIVSGVSLLSSVPEKSIEFLLQRNIELMYEKLSQLDGIELVI